MTDRQWALRLLACIDNTTLSGLDTDASVAQFCQHTRGLTVDGVHVAAVCVYPRFVRTAVQQLQGSGIKVASVAGAFPHGQLPLQLKVAEVEYAVAEGCHEVDVVINRGLLLGGQYNQLQTEVAAMRRAAQGRTLKVIIESGELPDQASIALATGLAIDAGADFVKTSTGKIAVGATLDAARTMLQTVADKVKINKKTTGFKAAGGISTVPDAIAYARLAADLLGDDFVNNQTFRIGASRLTDSLCSFLTI